MVVTTDTASAATLEGRFQEAWNHLRRADQASEADSPRAKLLAQPWTGVWQISESTKRPMGIAGNEGEFLIILRDVGVYLADNLTKVVMAAAAERLLEETVQWLKRRYGADSIDLSDDNGDGNNKNQP